MALSQIGFPVFQVIRQTRTVVGLVSKLGVCPRYHLTPVFKTFTLRQPPICNSASMSTDKGKSTSAGTHSDSDSDDGHKQQNDNNEPGTSSKSKSKPITKNKKKETLHKEPLTRGKLMTQQQKEVEKAQDDILSLSIDKKRKLYLCKNRYTVLDDIPTWPKHFEEDLNDSAAQKWWKRNKDKVVTDIREDLNVKISVFRGDITTLEIDAIVNAANESLLGGGGVDGAIHRAAGMKLLLECELLNGCQAGDAKITCGYKLPAKHVIHTVGPRGERPEVLEGCYQKSLDLMKENELTSVAFPCISTGIFGYPNLNAAKVALKTIRNWLETEDYAKKVERIILCLFLDIDVEIYNEQLQLYFPLERDESE